MNIEELKTKHCFIADNSFFRSYIEDHTKLSIQFAIEVLEELNTKMSFPNQVILNKIQELKQYLDG